MTEWPFSTWLSIAVRHFGLSPDAFWALSVCDWMALLDALSTPPMRKADLDQLLAQFPDEPSQKDKL